jgi:xylulokinase
LAIDLGTSGAKVGLVSTEGKVVYAEFEAVPLILVGQDGAEQSPNLWWQSISTAVRRILYHCPVPKNDIVAICTSSMGEETVPVDRAGNPLMNALNWMDQRGAPDIRKQVRGRVNVMGYGITKLWHWLRISGGAPSLSGKDPAGHITHIRRKYPDVYDKTHKFLNSLDYINLRLTGELAASYDSIITCWVTDNRDPGNVRYSRRLLAQLDIPREKLPNLVPATQVIGTLRGEVAQAWGLNPAVKVVAGSIDTFAATIGASAVRDFDPSLYIGTSSYITCHVPFKKCDLFNSMASFPAAVPGKYCLLDNQTTAGGNLRFIGDKLIKGKTELIQEEGVENIYQVFDQISARVPAGARGICFCPWTFGERSPMEDQTLRGGFFNLSLNHTHEDLIRAVFEGVAFNSRWLLQGVERFMGKTFAAIRFSGGGANSDVWSQIYADILNRAIWQVDEPLLVNTRGAAFIGAVGIGELSFRDIPDLVKIKQVYEPNPEHRALYDERFAVFQNFYHKTKGLYKRLNGTPHVDS